MLSSKDNETLTRVGPGTVMGEYLRRFWTPVLEVSELAGPDCDPVEVRILGEDFVAFRDTHGNASLLQALCPHRQAPLFYGRNEEGGLRCIYHGWKFDVGGQILDMPNEPPDSGVRGRIRAQGYPVREWAGVIWAYFGPAHLQPPEIPQLAWGLVPASHLQIIKYEQLCNWVQALEGDLDSSHISFLHRQLDAKEVRLGHTVKSAEYTLRHPYPKNEIVETEYGLMIGARRDAESDSYYWRVTQWMQPYFTLIPGDMEGRMGFAQMYVPIDDTHTRAWCPRWSLSEPLTEEQRKDNLFGRYASVRSLDPETGRLRANRENHFLQDRHVQRHQTFSGIDGTREQDTAMVEGMGPILDRTREHLIQSDAAVAAMRRTLLDNARALQQGQEPYTASHANTYRVRAWSAILNRGIGSFTNAAQVDG